MEDMVKEAIRLNLTSICFTDHHDMDFPVAKEGFDFSLDTDSYLKEFYRLKEKYDNFIELRIGVELGIMPHLGERLSAYMEQYGPYFDFVIGSTHIVDGLDPYEPAYYGKYPDEKGGMERYFEANLEHLRTFCQMDSFAHLDYAVRYAPHKDLYYDPKDYADLIDLFLKELIEQGIALEFNTAGLKYGMKQANPHIEILKRYRALCGELLTIGSDGHCPAHIAWDFARGEEILAAAGFSYYTVYKNRKPHMVKLGRA